MLKVENKTTKRIRVLMIIVFLVQIFLTAQPYVWEEAYYKDTANSMSIQKGDVVTIDFTGKVDGKTFKNSEKKSVKYTIGSNAYISGFDEKFIKHKKGESFSFKLTLPKKFSDKAVAGKKAEYSVRILDVSRKSTYTVLDMISNIGATTGNTNTEGILSTLGLCYILFLIIPIVALGFQIFDRKYNLKNVVGIICSALGVICILYFVGPGYLCFGSMIALLLYLFSAFMSVMGIFARFLKTEN